MPDPVLMQTVATTVRAPQHVHTVLKEAAAVSGLGIGAYLREAGMVRAAWLFGSMSGELRHTDAGYDPRVAEYVDCAVRRWLGEQMELPVLGSAEEEALPAPRADST